MKKFFNWFWVVVYALIPLYFLIILLYSVFASTKITELIDYDWWLFFFVFEMWGMYVAKVRMDEAFDKLKNK